MLVENAVAEKEAQQPKSRKPLADIGNTDVKQGGAKPKQRKNWCKTATIQLVPPSLLHRPLHQITLKPLRRTEPTFP
ncbi:Chromosome-associated kinesin KIF4A [Hordeum vulgare]|nr:Chromosome-associated kinesin KIF4A [Hordeum vulgare]